VHKHDRRPVADALIGDLEPVRPNDLHRRNLHAGRGSKRRFCTAPTHCRRTLCDSTRAGSSAQMPALSLGTICERQRWPSAHYRNARGALASGTEDELSRVPQAAGGRYARTTRSQEGKGPREGSDRMLGPGRAHKRAAPGRNHHVEGAVDGGRARYRR
jgi:hypothetical protein